MSRSMRLVISILLLVAVFFTSIWLSWGLGTAFIAATIFILLLLIAIAYQTSLIKKQPVLDKLSDNPQPIPQDLQDWHEALLAMGFTLAGEYQVSYLLRKTPQWLYFSKDHHTIAFLMHTIQPLAGFSNYFSDGFVLATLHPTGRLIETPYYSNHIVADSLYSAYDYHSARLEDAMLDNDLVIFADLQAFITWEHLHKHRGSVYQASQGIVFKLIGMVAVVVGMAISFFNMPDNPSILYSLGLIFVSILTIAYTINIIKSIMFPSAQRKKKKRD